MKKVTELDDMQGSAPAEQTASRKVDHIRINLERDVDYPGMTTGLENYRFVHRALPDVNLAEIAMGLELFGKKLSAPLFISSMTGGTRYAERINRNLAEAAQHWGIAMGVGSQRAAIEDPAAADTFRAARQAAPDILLFANLGAVQLNYGYGPDECRRAVDMIEADALYLHINPLQEAAQPEGDTNFKGLLPKIEAVCRALTVPVVAKEVGNGISYQDARGLADAGVAAIDVAGAGGTSWVRVESYRAESDLIREVGRCFSDWGVPTAEAICMARQAAPDLPIFASGGIRSGIDIAKGIALGATLCGIARPFLHRAVESTEAVNAYIELMLAELRVAMFGVGAPDLQALHHAPLVAA